MKADKLIISLFTVFIYGCSLPLYNSIDNKQIIEYVVSDNAGSKNYFNKNTQQSLNFDTTTSGEYYEMTLYLTHKNDNGLMKPKYDINPNMKEVISVHHFRLFLGDLVIEKGKPDPTRQSFVLVSYKSPVSLTDHTEGSTVFLLGDIEVAADPLTNMRYATIKQRRIYTGKEPFLINKDKKLYTKGEKYEIDLALIQGQASLRIIHAIDRRPNKIGSEYDLFYDLEKLYGFNIELMKRVQ